MSLPVLAICILDHPLPESACGERYIDLFH
jgi:hypothetical protein